MGQWLNELDRLLRAENQIMGFWFTFSPYLFSLLFFILSIWSLSCLVPMQRFLVRKFLRGIIYVHACHLHFFFPCLKALLRPWLTLGSILASHSFEYFRIALGLSCLCLRLGFVRSDDYRFRSYHAWIILGLSRFEFV